MSKIYDPRTARLIAAYRVYIRNLHKFASGYPSVTASRDDLNKAYDDVMDALQNDALHEKLNEAISENSEEASALLEDLPAFRDFLLHSRAGEIEQSLGGNIGLSKTKVRKIIRRIDGPGAATENFSVELIEEQFTIVHSNIVTQMDDARQLPKKEKGKRKRNLVLGGVSAAFGCGIIALNLAVFTNFSISLAAGMAPIGLAVRDVVGARE